MFCFHNDDCGRTYDFWLTLRNLMSSYLIKAFNAISPAFLVPQENILNWIATMHSEAEAKARSLSEGDQRSFYEEIQTSLHKIGLGKDKIAQRGVHVRDLQLQDPSLMEIYNIAKHPQGNGLKAKMDLYAKEADLLFERLYENSPIPSHLVHVTCTGYVSPSGAQKLVSKKRSFSTYVTHAYHMGCYGSLPALRIASHSLHAKTSCDIVHTEFCTLHMNPLCHSTEQLVIESLFADGFIKYSISHDDSDAKGLLVEALEEIIIRNSMDSMKWQCEDWGFGMTLAKDVPIKVAKALKPYLERLSNKVGLSLSSLLETGYFAIHPGGPKIIQQIAELLQLSETQISHSKEILRTRGNMSSATLPFIWESMLSDDSIESESYIVSLAFGPGLTISGAIFKKRG